VVDLSGNLLSGGYSVMFLLPALEVLALSGEWRHTSSFHHMPSLS
jgi:hypothetical protein